MPSIQCENGKWKWGESGSCKYDTKKQADDDNADYYRDLKDIDLTPPKSMVAKAKKGKEQRKEFGRGGTEVGLKTANMIIDNELSIERVKKMYAYFQRHEVDKKAEGFNEGEKGFPSAGVIAWNLWGGDPGMDWSTRKRNEIEKTENDDNERNIKIVSGSPCSGKNTYVKNNKRKGDIVWDFDKIHSALTDEDSHIHIENVRKHIFAMREKFYDSIKNEKQINVWIINSSPYQSVRSNLINELNAEFIYIKRSKEDCLEVAKNERPNEWMKYVESYFEKFEKFDDHENIKIIEVNDMKNEKRHVKEIIEDDETITIIYGKSDEWEGIKIKDSDIPDEGPEETIEENNADCVDCGCVDDNCENEIVRSNIWNNQSDMEKRFYDIKLEKRSKDGKANPVVVGHAAVFNTLNEDQGGFQERIDKNAFDDVLENDVRAFFNHDPNHLLARTSSGTLKLSVDEKGLKYEFSVPDTTSGRDLLVSMERGDISQSSFAFTIDDDSWDQENGVDIRTIKKVKRLYDVSPVSIPAYPGANDLAVAQRGLAINKETKQRKDEEIDLIKRNLLKLNIEILKRKKNEK